MLNNYKRFKMDDRVQVTELESCSRYRGKICIITNVDRIRKGLSNRWDYECTFSDGERYVFTRKELRHYPEVGKQLLLFEDV